MRLNAEGTGEPGLCELRAQWGDSETFLGGPACHRAWGGCGDSTWPKDNCCCFVSLGCSVENLQGGAEELICAPASPSTRHRGGDKTKGDFQVQDSIKVQPHQSQFHWLGYCLTLLEDLESIYKKITFLLFQEWQGAVTEQNLYCFQ